MQECGGKRGGIQPHIREDMCDLKEMAQVRLTRTAELIAMPLGSNVIRAAHHPGIFGRAVLAELLQQRFQLGVELAFDAIAVEIQRQVARRRHWSSLRPKTGAVNVCSSRTAGVKIKKGTSRGGALAQKSSIKSIWLGQWLGLFGPFLLDLFDLVNEFIGHLLVPGAFLRAVYHVRLAPIEQVQISHSIVIVWLDLNSFLQHVDTFID